MRRRLWNFVSQAKYQVIGERPSTTTACDKIVVNCDFFWDDWLLCRKNLMIDIYSFTYLFKENEKEARRGELWRILKPHMACLLRFVSSSWHAISIIDPRKLLWNNNVPEDQFLTNSKDSKLPYSPNILQGQDSKPTSHICGYYTTQNTTCQALYFPRTADHDKKALKSTRNCRISFL